MTKYEVDLELSGRIRMDREGVEFISDIIRTVMFGNSLLNNDEYIEKEGLSEEDVEEVNELVKGAKAEYIRILNNIEGNNDKNEEDLEEANKMARFISVDRDGVVALTVLKDTFVSSDEELIKFVTVDSGFVEEDEKLYFEV